MAIDWFGRGRGEAWRKLSTELGGDFRERAWLRREKVDVAHAHWTITLDIFVVSTGKATVPFTRLRAPFVATGKFRCKISRAHVFSWVGRLLGAQDVEIGDAAFDKAFGVKGNDEKQVRAFCDNAELRRLLLAQKGSSLSIRDHEGWFGPKFPADTDELRLVTRGFVKDLERLRGMFQLLARALDQLCAIGVARERRPSLQL